MKQRIRSGWIFSLALAAVSVVAVARLLSIPASGYAPPSPDVSSGPRARTALKVPTGEAVAPPSKGEHPLDPAIELAEKALRKLETVHGYTAKLVKRERVGDELVEPETIRLKVRQKPFSVYLKFLEPDAVKGREVIFVPGENDGKLLVHLSGLLASQLGTLALDPTGYLAMQGQRHPITEIGLKGLTEQLLERAKAGKKSEHEPVVKFFKGAKVGDADALRVEVTFTHRDPKDPAYRAVIYFDPERMIPLRYQGYGWPEKPGAAPPLLEDYAYYDIKLNPGLTDHDFQTSNPEYEFE
jgi:hypothetical protein